MGLQTVDVIIPIYNCEKHLSATLESLVKQTCQDFNIILVDDGSTDGSGKIISDFIRRYPEKIKYFWQSNRGPAAARNRGIKESSSPYIAFLDADDIWLPEKLEKQVKALKKNPHAGYVYCDCLFCDEQGRPIENYVRKNQLLRGYIILDLFLDHFIMTPAVLLKRECIEKIGLFNEPLKVGEDYDFFLRLANIYPAEVVEEKLWKRNIIQNSLSRQNFEMDAENDIRTLKNFLLENPAFHKEFRNQINKRLAGLYFDYGYRLLEHGKNFKAFLNFMNAQEYQINLKVVRNIFLCLIPFSLRKFLKDQKADKRCNLAAKA